MSAIRERLKRDVRWHIMAAIGVGFYIIYTSESWREWWEGFIQ